MNFKFWKKIIQKKEDVVTLTSLPTIPSMAIPPVKPYCLLLSTDVWK